MRTALFAIIIVNIVCIFDASMFFDNISFSSVTNKNIFTNLSTAIVTYVVLKDVSDLEEPSYINELIKSENTILGATSLKMIITLLVNGADEKSIESELMSYLKIVDKISLNKKYKGSETTFLNDNKNIKLNLENAIYVQKSVDLRADFSLKCVNKFHCSFSKVDFRDRTKVAETINSWIQETTNYEILHLIFAVNIDENTKIILVNTVYLNIGWPNLKRETKQRIFHISSSRTYFVSTIKFEKSAFIYSEIPHWNAKLIGIPFLNDKITMIILLPNEVMEPGNLEYLIGKINVVEFQSAVKNAYTKKFEQNMELYLPQFTIEYTKDMTDYFRSKGIITMLEDKTDFTHLSKIPLKMNNIVQKFSVRIKEEDLIIPEVVERKERKSVDPSQELIVDRPFLYLIVINGALEFSGAVYEPDVIFMRNKL